MNQWFTSSSSPVKLSATIGGFSVVGLAQTASMLLSYFGIDIAQAEIAQLLVAVMTGLGGLYAAFGLARKFYNRARKASA